MKQPRSSSQPTKGNLYVFSGSGARVYKEKDVWSDEIALLNRKDLVVVLDYIKIPYINTWSQNYSEMNWTQILTPSTGIIGWINVMPTAFDSLP
jgi:hypothetical protein